MTAGDGCAAAVAWVPDGALGGALVGVLGVLVLAGVVTVGATAGAICNAGGNSNLLTWRALKAAIGQISALRQEQTSAAMPNLLPAAHVCGAPASVS